MYNKLDLNQLENVSGGQFDKNADYVKKLVLSNGNLYDIHNLRKVVGAITAGQTILLNPDSLYPLDGHNYCFVKVNGTDYAADRENIES